MGTRQRRRSPLAQRRQLKVSAPRSDTSEPGNDDGLQPFPAFDSYPGCPVWSPPALWCRLMLHRDVLGAAAAPVAITNPVKPGEVSLAFTVFRLSVWTPGSARRNSGLRWKVATNKGNVVKNSARGWLRSDLKASARSNSRAADRDRNAEREK